MIPDQFTVIHARDGFDESGVPKDAARWLLGKLLVLVFILGWRA